MAYSTTCYFSVLLAVVRLVTAAQSPSEASSRLANSMGISMLLCEVSMLYPPLVVGVLAFAQVVLRFNKMCLECGPDIFWL